MAADDERPPFLSSWGAVYALVVGALAATIALLSWVSAVYR